MENLINDDLDQSSSDNKYDNESDNLMMNLMTNLLKIKSVF